MMLLHNFTSVVTFLALLLPNVLSSVNLVLNQNTKQSSTLNGTTTSDKAVDGRYGPTCAVTAQNSRDSKSYWQVRLAEISLITHLRFIFDVNDNRSPKLLQNYKIYVSYALEIPSGNLCYKETRGIDQIDPQKHEVFCLTQGKYITYYNEDKLQNINLCEVEVFGCPLGFYGSTCSEKCSEHCNSEYWCEPDFGYCTDGCEPGYKGPRCSSECETGTYGPSCALNCSINCLNGTCNNINGICTRCADGFTGDWCQISTIETTSMSIDSDRLQTTYITVIAALAVALLLLVVIIVYLKCDSSRSGKYKDKGCSNLVQYPLQEPITQDNIDYDAVQYESMDDKGFNQRKPPIMEYETPISHGSGKFSNSKIVGGALDQHNRDETHNNGQKVLRPLFTFNRKNPSDNMNSPNTGLTYEGFQRSNDNKHIYDSLNQK